jgi:hypothetical protein
MSDDKKPKEFDENIHIVPTTGNLQHDENRNCWCEPILIQDIDNEHNKQVWSHRGHEELNQ